MAPLSPFFVQICHILYLNVFRSSGQHSGQRYIFGNNCLVMHVLCDYRAKSYCDAYAFTTDGVWMNSMEASRQHYCIHQDPSLVPIFSQIKPVRTIPLYLSKVGNWIYWTLYTTCDCLLQTTVTNTRAHAHTHTGVLSYGFHDSSDNGFQRWTFLFLWAPGLSPCVTHSISRLPDQSTLKGYSYYY
jgi:hypothetical protein